MIKVDNFNLLVFAGKQQTAFFKGTENRISLMFGGEPTIEQVRAELKRVRSTDDPGTVALMKLLKSL